MKRSSLSAVFLVCLVLVVSGFNESGDSQSISIVLQGDPGTTAALKEILKEKPQLAIPGTETEYSIRVIKPDPSVDYTVVQITPDPNIDYSIIIIDPQSGKRMPDLSRKLSDALREKLQQKKKESKK